MAEFNVSLALRARDDGFAGEVRDAKGELKGLADDARRQSKAITDELSKPLGGRIKDQLTSWRDRWNKASGSVKSGFTNLALQAQDIAVQLEGGTSPLRVLLQQGTQIAGAFGPQGAVIGAIGAGVLLGIGSLQLLAGDGFAVAEQAVKDLDAALKEANRTLGEGATEADKLVKAYSGLSGKTQGLGAIKIRDDLIDTRRETEGLSKAFQGLVGEIEAASEARLAVGGSGLADIGGGFGPGSRLAGEITRRQAQELSTAVAGFQSGGLTDVQFIAEVQKALAGATDQARAFARELIDVADRAETGRVSLGELAKAGTEIEGLAEASGVHLQKVSDALGGVDTSVEKSKSTWASWYDALVGQSYIPDTVKEAEAWFDRMGTSLTSKTEESTSSIADAFVGLDRHVSGSLASMITSNKLALADFADFALGISNQILAGLIQIGIQTGLGAAFAPSTGAGAGAAVAHDGGIVGELARRRHAPLAIFADAPRFHDGGTVLRAGEVPIIAKRGERVVPAGQGGPVQIVNIVNQTGAKIEERRRRGPQGEDIRDILVREVNHAAARGDLDEGMSARFGLRPGG